MSRRGQKPAGKKSRRHVQRLRIILLLGTGLALIALTIGAFVGDVVRDGELDTVDDRFSIRGDQPIPSNQVIVAIDEQTFNELQLRFPFPRSVHAQAIDRLRKAEAKVIAYDVQFTEPTEPKEDNALIRAIAKATEAGTEVVLGTSAVTPEGETGVLGGDGVLKTIGAHAGNVNFPPDPGGVIRRMAFEISGLKSLSVVAAELTTGKALNPDSLGGDTAWIDYVGPQNTIPRVSFSQLVLGEIPPEQLRDKIVVIGAITPTLQDIRPTSVSAAMPGPEIQSDTIDTVLRDFPLQEAGDWLTVVLIIVFGSVGPLIALRFGPLRAIFAGLAVAIVYIVTIQLSFNSGLIISFLYPTGALLLGSLGALGGGLILNLFERQRVHDLFSRFVPEPIVDQVLAHTDEDLRLGGEERIVTVMFTDIRGFTSYSEGRPPEQVIEMLNRYLTGMSNVILDHGGTLISYIGDGIMAVFGAPIDQPDHADKALDAAREMTGETLARFAQTLREEGYEKEFRIGVGLNSGTVMAGNVGSERRLDYTAIGDTVNTASRLEGMTKGTPYMVFASDSTREMLSSKPEDLVFVDELAVRGRTTAVKVWALGESSQAKEER